MQRDLNRYGPRKSTHLLNVTLTTLKWLMIHGESHKIRLDAAKTMLEIPTIHALSGKLRTPSPRPYRNGRGERPEPEPVSPELQQAFEALIEAGGTQAAQAIQAVEAEISASNPNETKGNE